MKPAPQFASRSLLHASTAGQRATGGEGGAESEFSLAWKGWTNGGGERVSTAAQFSRFTEPTLATTATPPGTATLATGRTHAPAAAPSTAPAYPTNEAALLAPVHAALERLISRGQDQLAVTVRFEQGGSLSLKLTMRDGGIATHMQTDVPGLEEALRSSWNSFAQDWNQRGVKLAAPSFSGAGPDLSAGRDGQRSPQQDGGQGFTSTASSFGPSLGRRSLRSVSRAGGDAAVETVVEKSSLARAARRGLRTWA